MEQIAINRADDSDDTALPIDPRDLLYVGDARPVALLIANGPTAAGALLQAGGARLLDTVMLADAQARLDLRTHIDLVLVECHRPDPALLPLLARLNRLAAEEQIAVIAACGLDCIDGAFGLLSGEQVQLLCAPDPFDLAAAAAFALSGRDKRPLYRDIGGEDENQRIERLSAEVSRIARVLDSLTSDYEGMAASFRSVGVAEPSPAPPPHIADRTSNFRAEEAAPATLGFARPASPLEAVHMRDLLRTRRQRDLYFPSDLFADPAWDMMLDLMAARLAGERVSVSSLCIAAAVPPTTALRWIRQLTDRKLFVRQADPADGRRVFIALSDDAANALARWFAASRVILRDTLA